MQIVDNRALLLKVRNPNRITSAIPKSKYLGDNRVLVRWGIDEARVLRNLKVRDVPSPILGRYQWPGKYKPFAHQKKTASFLSMNQRAFCLSEMGTGKTASAIWASDYLLSQRVINRVLIICPLSIMESAWRNDLFQFAMHRYADVAYGKPDKRRAVIQSNAEYVIINYDGVAVVADEVAKGGFDLIIVDEATHYKNAQSKRWKVLNRLIKPETWVWLMTGTPAAQSPTDAYGLAKLIVPKRVPWSFTAFRDQVMYKVTTFKWVPKDIATDVVYKALQPAIRYTKEECLDLPPILYERRQVELGATQRKYYDTLKKDMIAAAAGELITSANAAVNLNKLLQVSCGAVYSDQGNTIEFDIKKRLNVLLEVIQESSKKVIVFIPYRHTIAKLAEELTDVGITTDQVHGGISAGKRTTIFNAFQNTPDPHVLLIQPQAAAHGVTLTAANTIVWWGPVASLETNLQANARIHRSGQNSSCTVIQLAGSAAENKIYNMLDGRAEAHEKIIDLYKEILDI